MRSSDDGNWSAWFPSETEAWKDYYEQLRAQGHARSPLGVAISNYGRVGHPRELGEPWYREPRESRETASAASESKNDSRVDKEPLSAREARRQRWTAEYWKRIGKEYRK